MAKKPKREARPPARGVLDERRRLIAAGSLSAAVLIVLVIGAVLRADAPFAESTVPVVERPQRSDAFAGPVAAENVPVETPPPRPAPLPASEPEPREDPFSGGTLAQRATSDPGRLVGGGGSYTLQLMVSCDPENARRQVEAVGDDPRLYVLPLNLDGKACYRLCWGTYDSRSGADSAADLPAPFDSPRVKTIAELAP